ncbi:MAG TPA: hypothetical protein VFR08_07640 [Candidatus Angelobacter sp.]|nr:hypothetical protein [Candidatus Angelobacter sp.]
MISPRRIVDNQGSPTPTTTPTPGTTPTPTPTPGTTPTPSPTPTPVGGAGTMSAQVNRVAEFLFVADEKSNSLQGFRINGDGALSAVTGSPFQIGDTPHHLLSSGDSLIMSGSAAIIVFQVDQISGALRQSDSVAASSPVVAVDPVNNIVYCTSNGETTSYRLVKGMLRTIGSAPQVAQSGTASFSGGPVIDATGSFAYALNTNTGQIDAFRVAGDKRLTPLDPPAYRAGNGAVSIALIAP